MSLYLISFKIHEIIVTLSNVFVYKLLIYLLDMKYVFGPVPSRRLGRSLGISPIPPKTCNYSCVYCQLGRTTNFTNKRLMFFPPDEIIEEVKAALEKEKKIDFITIVGDGEPTLYLGLRQLIQGIKNITRIPIAIITNGALLYQDVVRKDLLDADVVMPTFDAPNETLFRMINRPHKDITLEKLIEGLKIFRTEYKGEIWLEVMIIKEKNSNLQTISQIKDIIRDFKADKIYINVPIRPPAESWVEIPSSFDLHEAQKILNAENIAHYEEILIESVNKEASSDEIILEITERHPLREDQILSLFPNLTEKEVLKTLKEMKKNQKIEDIIYNKRKFWKIRK